MSDKQEIDWKKYVGIVIQHMLFSAKNSRSGNGVYRNATQVAICTSCHLPHNSSHLAGCDSCFEANFMENLSPIKIHEYIAENITELTDIITISQRSKNHQIFLESSKQKLIDEYNELYAHGDLFVVDQ